jgi:hypothetical protein
MPIITAHDAVTDTPNCAVKSRPIAASNGDFFLATSP